MTQSAVVDKFWVVVGTNTGMLDPRPTVIHSIRSTATEEAKRLAKKVPGAVFYIMEAQYGYSTNRELDGSAQKISVQIIDKD